ncbi:MAG: ArnT family glycosyltransferase [bacterium]
MKLLDTLRRGDIPQDSSLHTRRATFLLLAGVLTVTHFVFLILYFSPAISTPDAHGYFAQAKLIANTGRAYLEPESVLQYIGPHWLHQSGKRYFTTFPPGLPAILASIYKVFGPEAALLVNPLMASLSLLGLFLLCRLWIGERWGLLAFVLMAANPFANEHALFGDSHTSVAFFLVWALVFLALWRGRGSPWWAFAAGVFVGLIPAIRYPEVLFIVAFAVYVLLDLPTRQVSWRSILAAVVGCGIPIGMLCLRNQTAFGAFWRTGYSLSSRPPRFGFSYLAHHLPLYLQKLVFEGVGLVFVVGIVGLVFLCARRETRKQGTLLGLLVVPMALLYMSYFWPPDPESMRFLLPTFYAYTVGAVWLLKEVSSSRRLLAISGSVALLVITLVWGLPKSIRSMAHLRDNNAVLARVADAVQEHVEVGSIVMANEAISQHLDFLGYWRLADASVLRPLFTPAPGVSPPRGLRNAEARRSYSGLSEGELFDRFSQDVWKWAGTNERVYLIARREQITRYDGYMPEYDRFEDIAQIQVPRPSRDAARPPPPLRPRMSETGHAPVPAGPAGPDHIFDLLLDGEPLFIVEWIRASQ